MQVNILETTCEAACQAPTTPIGSIAGYKYNDLNQDGIHDAGELGLGGWTIFVDIDGSGYNDNGDIQYTTNENGYYGLPNVPVGTYNVCEITDGHPGWTNSGPICQEVVVTQDNTTEPVDFFNYEVPTGTIEGYKYNDLNHDGDWDEGEPGMGGWNIWVDLNDNGIYDGIDWQTTTDGDAGGLYRFPPVPVETYDVCEILDENHLGWTSHNDLCQEVIVSDGETTQADFFNYEIPRTGSLTICKYEDKEPYGGTKGSEDTPLPWNIHVHGNGELNYDEDFTTDSVTGCKDISELEFGSYTVSETLPTGWDQIYPSGNGGNQSQTVELISGNPDQSIYFLNYNTTNNVPTMYSCNPTTLQCALADGGLFASYQGCVDACGASAGGGGQYVAVVAGAATEQGGAGQVAGASAECKLYLFKYIKLGADNDPEEVKKLESFLNEYLGVDLPINGIYEEVDYNAVKEFQFRLKNEILAPWVAVGCLPSIDTPTGYVYRTTQWAINNMFCPIPKPDVSDEKCEGGIIIGFGEGDGTVLGESTTTPTTTTETTPPEETGTTVTSENGVNPSQNWLWYLMGIIIIGGAVYLVYSKKTK